MLSTCVFEVEYEMTPGQWQGLGPMSYADAQRHVKELRRPYFDIPERVDVVEFRVVLHQTSAEAEQAQHDFWDNYAEFEDYREDEWQDRVATESEAHAEWHRNSGVPMGQPCPWDACDPADHYYPDGSER